MVRSRKWSFSSSLPQRSGVGPTTPKPKASLGEASGQPGPHAFRWLARGCAQQPLVVRDDRGAVRVLTMNRPEARNASSLNLISALHTALADADRNPPCARWCSRVADPAFCAGLDVKQVAPAHRRPDRAVPRSRRTQPAPNPSAALSSPVPLGLSSSASATAAVTEVSGMWVTRNLQTLCASESNRRLTTDQLRSPAQVEPRRPVRADRAGRGRAQGVRQGSGCLLDAAPRLRIIHRGGPGHVLESSSAQPCGSRIRHEDEKTRPPF
jgi:hypothetical protein